MSQYRETAAEAAELLKRGGPALAVAYEPLLAAEFLISAAVLSLPSASRKVELADVLEFLDVRQHVGLAAREAAAFVAVLTLTRILKHENGTLLSFTDSGWDGLPRTASHSLALSKRDKRRWVSMLPTPPPVPG